MRHAYAYELPEDRLPDLRRAVRLEIATLIFMSTVVVLMGLVVGNSQAMRTAWIEDMLVLVPAAMFLIVSRVRRREPSDRFPYGFHRAVSIGFLVSAAVLLGFGMILLYDAVGKLVRQEHSTIGSVSVFGHLIWQGWLMLPVLVYATVGPMILGYLKIEPARRLHDKVLYVSAETLKADWLTAVAAAVGVIGIGFGWWWADAAAAAAISLDILYDGGRTVRAVIGELMDGRPSTVDLKTDAVPDRLREELRRLPWARDVDLRMRESGHVFFGEAFIVPVDERDPIARSQEAVRAGQALDWRINTLVVQLVDDLSDVGRV